MPCPCIGLVVVLAGCSLHSSAEAAEDPQGSGSVGGEQGLFPARVSPEVQVGYVTLIVLAVVLLLYLARSCCRQHVRHLHASQHSASLTHSLTHSLTTTAPRTQHPTI
jgi:hypothetical protein